VALDLGDAGVGFEAEQFGGLFAGADATVGPGEQERDAEADGGTGEPTECGSGDAGAGCAEAAFLDGDGLGAFEGGEHELAGVGLEVVELFEHHAVLARECVELGAGDRVLDPHGERILGVGGGDQHLSLDLVDLRLEGLEAQERGTQPVLAEFVLAFRQVADQFVGDGVGVLDGVVGVALRGGDAQCAALLVGGDGDLRGERGGRPVEVDRLGGPLAGPHRWWRTAGAG
jgi:hypothetical protein